MHPVQRTQIRATIGFAAVGVVLGALVWLLTISSSDTLFHVCRAGLTASCALLGFELHRTLDSKTGLSVCISFGVALVVQVLQILTGAANTGQLATMYIAGSEYLHLTTTFPTAVLLLMCLLASHKMRSPRGITILTLCALFAGCVMAWGVDRAHAYTTARWGSTTRSLYGLSALMLIPLAAFSRLYIHRPSSFLLGICLFLLLALINIGQLKLGTKADEISQLLDLLAHASIPFGFAVDGIEAMRHTRLNEDSGEDLAQRDPLTRVYNRRALDSIGSALIDESLTQEQAVSVLMFDIDYFKKVNDVHGHAAGDAVLRQFAGILSKSVRGTDLVARYGGEEFTAILPSAPLAPAIRLAERIRATVEKTEFRVGDKTLRVTVSVGAATAFPEEPRTLQAVIDNADRNLYRAKKSGRNRVMADPLEQTTPGRSSDD